MADLKGLSDLIGKLAPSIGTALGGPLAGAAVSVLAEIFGTTSSEAAVAEAIKTADPAVIAANLAAAEAKFKAAAEEAITQREQINAHVEMMRLDYERGWWHGLWRPAAGWIATLFAGGCCVLVLWEGFHGNYAFLGQSGNVLMIGGPIMALAGIYSIGKDTTRNAIAAGPGANVSAITGAIKKALGR